MKPPPYVLEHIEKIAGCSPCAKSKRAAVVFDPTTTALWGVGYNTLPKPMVCDGSAACRRDCRKICLHAESMALHAALVHHTAGNGAGPDGVGQLAGLVMLHVKVVDGQVVPGGPPSCWQCSREILEHELAGMWLFEITRTNKLRCDVGSCDTPVTHAEHFHERIRAFCDHHTPWSGHHERCPEPCAELCGTGSEWRYYTAEEFHRATLRNCGLHVGDLPVATHVLWGGEVICGAAYLRGAPGDWPKGQTWISLEDVERTGVGDVTCRTCANAAPQKINGLKQIGARK